MKKYIKATFFILMSFIIPLFIETYVFSAAFNFLRFTVLVLGMLFVSSFYIFDFQKELDFLWNKRYLIGFLLLIFLVVFGFHGSSISKFNNFIQPNNIPENSNPLIGIGRDIRGDEWGVSTPTLLSQKHNKFNKSSSILYANDSKVSLYPKIPSWSLSILATPNQLGFLFLPVEQAYSFYWYFGYFLLFFASLELLMLITKKNKFYSFIGAILITLAPAVQWWEAWSIVGFGSAVMVLFDKYLKQDKLWKKLLLGLLIGYFGCCYIMCIYPAWQIPFGFFFLVLTIWIINENKNNNKHIVKDILILIAIIVATIAIIIVPTFIDSLEIYKIISNTTYPGKRVSTGGNCWQLLFNYLVSIFTFCQGSPNASEMSQYISLYPAPIILGIYCLLKNGKKNKKDILLIGLIILSFFLTIWNFIELPEWLAKISLLSMSTTARSTNAASYAGIVLLIYCLSTYADKKTNENLKYQYFIIALLICFLGITTLKNYYPTFVNYRVVILDLIIFLPTIYWVLINNEKTNKIAMVILAIVTFMSGVLVHPISTGLSVLFDKPISKEIQKIEKKNPDANWITIDTQVYYQNYLVANGADTINSTNYFPNMDLWEDLELQKYEKIYNRYAHIAVKLTNEESSVELLAPDLIEMHLNSSDICKLDLDYILTTKDIKEYENEDVKFEEIYNFDGTYIYAIKCQ